jgi:hypothetical protein
VYRLGCSGIFEAVFALKLESDLRADSTGAKRAAGAATRPRFGSFLGELHPLLDLLACDSCKNSLKVCSVEAILAHQSLNPAAAHEKENFDAPGVAKFPSSARTGLMDAGGTSVESVARLPKPASSRRCLPLRSFRSVGWV